MSCTDTVFRPGRLLIIYGQLGKDALDRLHRLDPHSGPKADRDQANSDARLARAIQRMTDDAEGVVKYLLDTMNGIDRKSKRRICHNTRLAAARELLKRGYPCECSIETRRPGPRPLRPRPKTAQPLPTTPRP